jgi:glucokinase
MLLAGDIGGTNTRLALYAPETGARHPVAEAKFNSAEYAGLEVIARRFLADTGRRVAHACFDVAGPVIDGRAHLTNLPWTLDEAALAQALGIPRATLLNDLKAVAYAVPRLQPADFVTLNAGVRDPTGAIAVVAPGTGLGEAFLVWDGARHVACSSEGGHAGFAPADARQSGLRDWLARRFGHVSCERVLSGPGIANIYDYLCETAPGRVSAEFAASLADAPDRTPLIAQAGLADDTGTSLAGATLAMFAQVLGAEAGDLALKVLATGGVYLAGGIPRRMLSKLSSGDLMQAFTDKGRMSPLLSAMPVHVVTAPAALLGAALFGLDQMQAIG